MTLQGKDAFAHEIYNAIKAFTMKLNLSERGKQCDFTRFQIIKSLPVDERLSHKYSTRFCALRIEFDRRLVDFKSFETDFILLLHRFLVAVVEGLLSAK